MSGFRRYFWDVKNAFLGQQFLMSAPVPFLSLIGAVALPIQGAFILHKGYYVNDYYYDMQDDDVQE